jgi:hypothetical protein
MCGVCGSTFAQPLPAGGITLLCAGDGRGNVHTSFIPVIRLNCPNCGEPQGTPDPDRGRAWRAQVEAHRHE